jgi:proteic killer suppression protein
MSGDSARIVSASLAACQCEPAGGEAITLDAINATRYYMPVIVSYRDSDTEALGSGRRVRRFVAFESVARRKLRQLEIAGRLDDLRVPPGNHLEALKGNRAGQYSIRINDQFRVCFTWTSSGPEDVEIVDYH